MVLNKGWYKTILGVVIFCFLFVVGIPRIEARGFDFWKPLHEKRAQEIKARKRKAAKTVMAQSLKTQSGIGILGLGGTGSISGVVRDVGGSPIANIEISLRQGDDPNWADDDAWDWVDAITTSPDGSYQFTGLEERRYHLNIHQEQYGPGENHYLEADQYQIQVFEGAETPNIDFAMRQARLIFGNFIDEATGKPVISAHLYSDTSYDEEGENDHHHPKLDYNGKYDLWVYPSPGKFYTIAVHEAINPGTTYEVYGGNTYMCSYEHPLDYGYTFLGSATSTHTFTDGNTYRYYAILAKTGYLTKVDYVEGTSGSFLWAFCTGMVDDYSNFDKNDGGKPAIINTYPMDNQGGHAIFDTYTGLTSITVHIVDDHRLPEPVYYVPQFSPNLYQSTVADVQGPNFSFVEASGKIQGTIVNKDGNPVKDVRIRPYIFINGMQMEQPDYKTDANGIYTLSGLPATTKAYVYIDDDEVMSDGVKYGMAEVYTGPLTVAAGATTNAPDMTIQVAGMISGQVTDENGVPIVGAEVWANGFDINGNSSRLR